MRVIRSYIDHDGCRVRLICNPCKCGNVRGPIGGVCFCGGAIYSEKELKVLKP